MALYNRSVGGGTDINDTFDNSSLSQELLEKAERELMEKPSWRDRDIQALRDMIVDDPDLVSRSDDAFLLRFLRARKFDYSRSFTLLQNYYMMRVKHANIFKDFTPTALKHVHQLNLQGFLPFRDPEGRAIFVFRGGLWDPSLCSADDLFRANVICLEKQIDDPLTQINGVVAILDMKSLGFHHVRHFSPSHALKVVSLVQDSFPARFKAVHIVNEPALFDLVLTIVKPLISEKLKKRIYTHGSNMKTLHSHIPTDILPSEFGGLLGPFNNKAFIEKLAEEEETFIQSQMYGYISQIAEKGVKKTVSLETFSPYRRVCIR
ncbi:alpha-tocopherol transfer protein-like [Argiope bruennichi]|uniref:Alpha-tocopherol transfer protein-like like protein n=1 Tax=Argiope bruennichi TaxID=94029 RepID=A0A8T0ESU0_ARGBR|nr:alpha-tocopherol transfer protein-like [Argiope bruennichi]XP_055944784.1 alpha-tocopherol transfer protein-like [Argiope bruennichi]KAF8778817.1 Alpha-tocopherol transfer protein-like like protein [Argiope bruennichi]